MALLTSQIKDFQDSARRSLQGGQPAQALPLLSQARELDPQSSETLMLQGIALSRLNQPTQATETFAQATLLAPDDAKILYNYAVHLYSFGFREQALQIVRRALDVNPEHPASVELARQLGDDRRAGVRPPTIAPVPRGGYDQSPDLHTLPFLAKISSFWTGVGWAISLLGLVVFGLAIAQLFVAVGTPNFMTAFTSGAAYGWLQGLYVFCLVATILFGGIDLIDRRASGAWLIPLALMPIVGLGWLALPLYLAGRPK